uniref:Uncharacterized protein n=1 Tax=Chlorella vulgaris TaxID=3077 RepID=V9H182_CHLVU|nr:hypothetical protein ChvulCp130 [Chlorella vulgaris]pir/T07316/ hypothetical protein 48f - Chlorella vulgaris chloroplast [Chlorella vulgaris]BAA57964.1 unnamed protein product [Chlorella vulgaris]
MKASFELKEKLLVKDFHLIPFFVISFYFLLKKVKRQIRNFISNFFIDG